MRGAPLGGGGRGAFVLKRRHSLKRDERNRHHLRTRGRKSTNRSKTKSSESDSLAAREQSGRFARWEGIVL